MRLLCLSNGHGEDAIAVRILTALRQSAHPPDIAALPIVGAGHAYLQADIPVIGSVKTMPSGGFIYMDGRQLARDIRGGLLSLTWAQIQAVRSWAREDGGDGGGREGKGGKGDRGELVFSSSSSSPPSSSLSSPSLILAVGDIVPLLFAWLSGVPYAFVGTAKSEYYLRDEAGWLPRSSWWSDRLERWTGCVYHPWERWLMSRPNCKAVFPRDRITANVLQRFGIPAVDLGNPMMDGLEWGGGEGEGRGDEGDGRDGGDRGVFMPSTASPSSSASPSPSSSSASPPPPALLPLTIVLLPGSRPPEAYENWDVILQATNNLIAQMGRSLVLLAAISPGLDLEVLHQMVRGYRWQQMAPDTYAVGVGEQQATLVLASDRYAEFLHRADFAIAMAGTATEQFVGLGKPAIVIPGNGPQFTAAFAEAQTRLLGVSVSRVEAPIQVTAAMQRLLNDPERLHLIAKNGQRRMGQPGAADRIAQCLVELLA